MPIIDTSDFVKTGGLTIEELKIYNLLNYELLKLPEFKDKEVDISNAIHLIQAIFMARTMIRLTEGKFWVKYDLPYENNFELNDPPKIEKYNHIIDSYLQFYKEFQILEPYHPYHLDDIKRALNALWDIILQNQTI